jgi:putative chitobiose transport system permease protein
VQNGKATPWIFLSMPLLGLLLVFIIPLLSAFWMSLHSYTTSLREPQFVGLDNYRFLLTNSQFWHVLQNTTLLMLMVVPALVMVSLGMAILLNSQDKAIPFFRSLLYFPVIVSVVVAALMFKWLLMSDGLINQVLSSIGLSPVGWLVSPKLALFSVGLLILWKGAGYYMVMYLASLQSVDRELYDAAMIDGATGFKKHWVVTLPHLKPTIAMVALISAIGALKAFAEMLVLTKGGPIGSSETVVYYIYNQAFGQLNLGLASSAGFILMLVIMALSWANIQLVFNRFEREVGHA